MKKLLLFILTIIFNFNGYSQITFEKGYYINNSNQKVDGLIKNIDWLNNPTQFVYKSSENGEPKTLTIESVKEFGVYTKSKYIKHNVNIDRSSNSLSELSYVKKPIFKKETLFLKLLVEGKASLYAYEDGNLKRFFFQINESTIEQLVFKKFMTTNDKIDVNNGFKQQLWNNLKCEAISLKNIENLDYRKKELLDFFIRYNECSASKFINYESKTKKDLFNLTLRPGINSTSLSINNRKSNTKDADFGNELGFRFGIEAEFIMPFNKNKWAILIEPTYQYFNSKQNVEFGKVAVTDYKSIELPIGIRHYFHLNNSSKFFINGSFILDFPVNSNIDFGAYDILDINTGYNFAFGMGYNYKNKYSLEFRYFTNRDLFNNYMYWESNYNTSSLIFGYTIF